MRKEYINMFEKYILNAKKKEAHEYINNCNSVKELKAYKKLSNDSYYGLELTTIQLFISSRLNELEMQEAKIQETNINQTNINPFMMMWFRLKEFLSEYENFDTEFIFKKMREIEIELSYPCFTVKERDND